MSDVRVILPADHDEASDLYAREPLVNTVVELVADELEQNYPEAVAGLLRGEYGRVLRVPAILVFGTEPSDELDEQALPECAALVESEPRGPAPDDPRRFRVFDPTGTEQGEGVVFSTGRTVVEWFEDGAARPETYEDLGHARRATADVRFEFLDVRALADGGSEACPECGAPTVRGRCIVSACGGTVDDEDDDEVDA